MQYYCKAIQSSLPVFIGLLLSEGIVAWPQGGGGALTGVTECILAYGIRI